MEVTELAKIAFLFPGQGSQSVGMGKDIHEAYPAVREIFDTAEAVWGLEEQGQLGGVPLNVRLDLPKGWDKDPKAVHGRLVEAKALDLSPEGIETFKAVKQAWDAKRAG